ncbi:hypothetical protein PTSG_11828 [Salpingoeca rosetta]|uniref:Uncharacterized protein n=1 Tax=Salpingoeca rosetta (strain ATCC 50818 / BSB-021) TaxID=946362 RepID=F2TZR2_SALR5|nr:uncharacterized protein PTSG_11828 [Salpingoeca rosetta]EGD79086.1 hypothetical protein PTSG_11828 [Salpingoeca rosetta]|eukprot:XP_004998042.1 hypothetical protein PTSG_11828 [Salpingoeca rosetta]
MEHLAETFEHGKRPVIAVDLDEVLGYFVDALCEFHNDKYGTTYKASDFHSYTFQDVWGGTKEESSKKVHDFLESKHFKNGLRLVPGAQEALAKLAEKYDLVIVTSRQHIIAPETHEWVETHFPNTFKSILFGNHWGLHGEKKSKPEMCTAIGAAVLIDDALHYARECAGHLQKVLLFGEYSWNAADDTALPEGVVRVRDWDAVLSTLDTLELK